MQRDSDEVPQPEGITGRFESKITAVDGTILGTLAGFVELTPAVGGLIGGVAVDFAVEGKELQQPPLDSPPPAPAGAQGADEPGAAPEAASSLPSRSEASRRIDAVWAYYVAVMKPRKKEAGEEERAIIGKALKVASVEEIEVCIRLCEESDYHQKRGRHATRKGQKYRSISKILKPRPRFEETQRSRIDWWLDKEKSSGVAGFPSADGAIVRQHQLEVQRGHGSDDSDTVRKATIAEAWLSEHGIETIRRESDGFPTFRRADVRDEDE